MHEARFSGVKQHGKASKQLAGHSVLRLVRHQRLGTEGRGAFRDGLLTRRLPALTTDTRL